MIQNLIPLNFIGIGIAILAIISILSGVYYSIRKNAHAEIRRKQAEQMNQRILDHVLKAKKINAITAAMPRPELISRLRQHGEINDE